MRRFLLGVAALFLASPILAAPAFDAYSERNGSTGSLSWTHTPVGTPRAVICMAFFPTAGAADATAFTYGGEAMTEIDGSPNNKAATEAMSMQMYFLGEGIPSGAQTAAVTKSAWAQPMCMTLTADDDTEIVTVSSINSDSLLNPSVNVPLGGVTSFVLIGFASGHNSVPASCAPLANWTARDEEDEGTQGHGLYTYDVVGSTDVTAGWTATAEDAVALAPAIAEVGGAPAAVPKMTLIGIGP